MSGDRAEDTGEDAQVEFEETFVAGNWRLGNFREFAMQIAFYFSLMP